MTNQKKKQKDFFTRDISGNQKCYIYLEMITRNVIIIIITIIIKKELLRARQDMDREIILHGCVNQKEILSLILHHRESVKSGHSNARTHNIGGPSYSGNTLQLKCHRKPATHVCPINQSVAIINVVDQLEVILHAFLIGFTVHFTVMLSLF